MLLYSTESSPLLCVWCIWSQAGPAKRLLPHPRGTCWDGPNRMLPRSRGRPECWLIQEPPCSRGRLPGTPNWVDSGAPALPRHRWGTVCKNMPNRICSCSRGAAAPRRRAGLLPPAAATQQRQLCDCSAAAAAISLQRCCCSATVATPLLQRCGCSATAAALRLQRYCWSAGAVALLLLQRCSCSRSAAAVALPSQRHRGRIARTPRITHSSIGFYKPSRIARSPCNPKRWLDQWFSIILDAW